MRDRLNTLRDFFSQRKHAYKSTFSGALSRVVLEDLARFCRANESTFDIDPRKSAVMEGRREVWLRIQHHLKLSDDELFALYTGRPVDARIHVLNKEQGNDD